MTRQILFRGQRLDNDEWAYGDFITESGYRFMGKTS